MNTFNETTCPVAVRPGSAQARTGGRKYLSFQLGGETYGIDILHVQEVRTFEQPTHLAQTEPPILGVVSLRGEIVPVVDLRVQLAIKPSFDALTITAVLNVSGHTIGVVVDSVSDVIELPPEQIKAAPALNGAIRAGHLTGMATIGQGADKRLLALLDIEQVLSGAPSALDTHRAH